MAPKRCTSNCTLSAGQHGRDGAYGRSGRACNSPSISLVTISQGLAGCSPGSHNPEVVAIGQYGSIAVLERFMRTFKDEGLRHVFIPLNPRKMRGEVNAIICWYNRFRPHSWLGGRTPEERYRRIPAACRRPRFEPRQQWPVGSGCASPPAKVRGQPGVRLQLAVDYHQGRKHLPIVTLKRAA